jgi:hypothetical protein
METFMRLNLVMLTCLFFLIFLLSGCNTGSADKVSETGEIVTLDSLSVTPEGQDIASGETLQFGAEGTYSDDTTKDLTSSVVWESSDTDVVTINNKGLVTAVAEGTATITATSDDISGSAQLTVTVTADTPPATSIIIDHTSTKLADIPIESINQAKTSLHIAYGHTSHGSQLVTGMSGLYSWKGSLYAFNNGGTGGALDLRDTPFSGASDLGNPDRTSWASATRTYLNANPDINVVIWSWCGQVSSATQADINTYLSLMTGLETDYPGVKFVYMTGHLDGSSLTGNLHLRNEQIRNYCRDNNKILYDFEDIESYNPDGTYFGDKIPNDACDYDSNSYGTQDANWAVQWQDAHTNGVDWFDCSAAHSQPLNGNLKAYAAWWLWAILAGWSGN